MLSFNSLRLGISNYLPFQNSTRQTQPPSNDHRYLKIVESLNRSAKRNAHAYIYSYSTKERSIFLNGRKLISSQKLTEEFDSKSTSEAIKAILKITKVDLQKPLPGLAAVKDALAIIESLSLHDDKEQSDSRKLENIDDFRTVFDAFADDDADKVDAVQAANNNNLTSDLTQGVDFLGLGLESLAFGIVIKRHFSRMKKLNNSLSESLSGIDQSINGRKDTFSKIKNEFKLAKAHFKKEELAHYYSKRKFQNLFTKLMNGSITPSDKNDKKESFFFELSELAEKIKNSDEACKQGYETIKRVEDAFEVVDMILNDIVCFNDENVQEHIAKSLVAFENENGLNNKQLYRNTAIVASAGTSVLDFIPYIGIGSNLTRNSLLSS